MESSAGFPSCTTTSGVHLPAEREAMRSTFRTTRTLGIIVTAVVSIGETSRRRAIYGHARAGGLLAQRVPEILWCHSRRIVSLQSIIVAMAAELDARALLESLVGQQITTVTGRPNAVLGVTDSDVIVGTDRSPAGERVPIESVQSGLERLLADREIEVSPRSPGYRSSFIGSVLLTLPDAVAIQTSPPRIRLADPLTAYRASEVGQVNHWWADDPRQRFWLEITDRPDIGVDLHCPQRDAVGHHNPGYSLIWWVQVGDVIFHYDKNEHAITAWSRAAGHVTEAPTVWLSHRGATRRRLQHGSAQPGWWLDLDGPFPLDPPVTLGHIRERASGIRAVLDALRSNHPGSLYFPFSFYRGTEPRPQQPYLNKLPARVRRALPLARRGGRAGIARRTAPA
jgi:hypothetical protein